MRYDPHSGAYVGAPSDEDTRTDAQKAEDAPLERKVNAVGGFIVGAVAGVVLTLIMSGPKRGS